jgi:hypothetical protein
VLDRLAHAEGPVEGDQPADDEPGDPAAEALRAGQLRPDHRELRQRRVQQPLLQLRVPGQHQAQHGGEQEQGREE